MELLNDKRYEASPALTRLEDEHDVEIIGAWATGARARGTAHDWSDTDVFAIGVNEPSNLVTDRTSIYREFETFTDHGTGVDVQLWSLEAVYDGILDDNPTVIHGLDSEKAVRIGSTTKMVELREYVLQHCNTYQLLHHYRSLAKDNYHKYIVNKNDPTVGRLFFITDALLRAWYIEETGNLPPYSAKELSVELEPLENTVGAVIAENNYLGYKAQIIKKQKGRTDQDLFEEWSEDDIELIERELGRSPREYDQEIYGTGVDGTTLSAMLRRIAEETWNHDTRGAL